jgi:FkbM family methyltransferase
MTSPGFIANITSGIKKRLTKLMYNPYKEVNVSWWRLKYYKHLPAGKIRVHQLFGKSLFFISAPELLHGLQEIFIDQIYQQVLPSNPYIIDCGANIGMSIIYLKSNFPDAEIIAFEPDEINFELLNKNMQSFGYTTVDLHKEAVWNENTKLMFSNESSMGSKIELNSTAQSVEVQAIRLKDFLTKKVDFLKIDIEGAEYAVLSDIADNLHHVQNMFLEYHGSFSQNGELAKIIQIIDKAGFNFYIKEAAPIYFTPFYRIKNPHTDYDVQLNLFCFRI